MARTTYASTYDDYRAAQKREEANRRKKILLWILAGLAAVIIVFLFFTVFYANIFFSMVRDTLHTLWFGWLFPNGWNLLGATPFFWLLVSAAVVLGLWAKYYRKNTANKGRLITLSIVVGVAVLGLMVRGVIVNEANAAIHYLGTTKFVVSDTNKLPDSLVKLSTSDQAVVGITEGTLPTKWGSRVASSTGAEIVLRRTGDALSNTELMGNTLTYIYNTEGEGGQWTAIRNGKNQQPLYGVASWAGTGETVKTCRFEGQNALDKSFGGLWGKNLGDTIAQQFPLFTYALDDAWGFCRGDQPVIVIPGTQTVGYDVRTVNQANGVLEITGSPSGAPVITHHEHVKPGDFPGPVYPQRLVSDQIDSVDWGGGWNLSVFQKFGYESTNVSSQAGNSRNYLLRNETDKRLYWVTPMKPKSSDSQTLVAYSVTPADQIDAGVLNEQLVYVIDGTDPRVVNLDTLQNRVIDDVRTADPGFFTGDSPGKIVEFLPVSDKQWQVFAEVGGRVKYRVDVNVGAQLTTRVVHVDGPSTDSPVATAPTTGTAASCDNPTSLSDAQLAKCLADLANALQQRQSAATG